MAVRGWHPARESEGVYGAAGSSVRAVSPLLVAVVVAGVGCGGEDDDSAATIAPVRAHGGPIDAASPDIGAQHRHADVGLADVVRAPTDVDDRAAADGPGAVGAAVDGANRRGPADAP